MRGVLRLTLALALLAAAAGCRRDGAPSAAPAERPNVLLVTIDTLRADHLGCYGLSGCDHADVDALARRGVRFATAVAQRRSLGRRTRRS